MAEISNKGKTEYFPIVKRIYTTHGLSAFWNGLTPTIFRNVPGTGIYFLTLDYLKRTKIPDSAFTNLAYGSISRIIAGQILMPFTVLKINQESKHSKQRTLSQIANRIYRVEGLKGFYKGSFATIMRDGPSAGIFYMTYQWTKEFFPKPLVRKKLFAASYSKMSKYLEHKDLCNILSSINASIFSMIITNPFDVIKTRVQLLDNQSDSRKFYQVTWTKIKLNELFRGIGVRMIRKSLNSAIVWFLYENLYQL